VDWEMEVGPVDFEEDTFYKVRFLNSGGDRELVSIHEVDPNDFEVEINTLLEFVSTSPAGTENLVPYWAAPSSSRFYLTAFRIVQWAI